MTKREYYLFGSIGLVWFLLSPHAAPPIVLLLIVNVVALAAKRCGFWHGKKLWIATDN